MACSSRSSILISSSIVSLSRLSSLAYDLHVLDLVAPLLLKSLVGPKLRRSTWVSIPPPYLNDYHCSFALVILYEPHTYREAHIDPLW